MSTRARRPLPAPSLLLAIVLSASWSRATERTTTVFHAKSDDLARQTTTEGEDHVQTPRGRRR